VGQIKCTPGHVWTSPFKLSSGVAVETSGIIHIALEMARKDRKLSFRAREAPRNLLVARCQGKPCVSLGRILYGRISVPRELARSIVATRVPPHAKVWSQVQCTGRWGNL